MEEMKNADLMKRKFRDYDRFNREIDEISTLIKDKDIGPTARKHLIQSSIALKKEASRILADVIQEQGDRVEEPLKEKDYKGIYHNADAFGVNDRNTFRKRMVAAIRQYFAMGYLRGYRQALRDMGEL